jgi:hypothetical protein
VTAMLRLGSLLMMFFLMVPIVRDCCLPVIHALPCHESKQADDETCFSNQQAIAETKGGLSVSSPNDYQLSVADDVKSAMFTPIRLTLARIHHVPTPISDIYLRTGALLI